MLFDSLSDLEQKYVCDLIRRKLEPFVVNTNDITFQCKPGNCYFYVCVLRFRNPSIHTYNEISVQLDSLYLSFDKPSYHLQHNLRYNMIFWTIVLSTKKEMEDKLSSLDTIIECSTWSSKSLITKLNEKKTRCIDRIHNAVFPLTHLHATDPVLK